MMTIEVAQERFVEVAYPRTLRAAQRAFKSWHERKRQDAVQECLAKMWDQWVRLVNRGRNPEPLLNGLIKYRNPLGEIRSTPLRESPQHRRDGLQGRHEAARN